jgi:hypothetical protein
MGRIPPLHGPDILAKVNTLGAPEETSSAQEVNAIEALSA